MTTTSIASKVAPALTFISLSICPNSFAKDLEMLTRLLIPAYIAQNFMVLCIQQDARFLAGVTFVGAFTEHVKQEIAADLPEQEAAQVRLLAADTARDIARKEMESIRGDHFNVPDDVLKKWCEESAKPLFLKIVRNHQETHGKFEMLVAGAKR